MPYLRTTRNFSSDERQLRTELSKAYLDTANCINARTIGLFSSNHPAITGESWFINKNQRQQTLRQVYPFGAITAGTELDIPTGITSFTQFTRIYGTVITANGSSGKPDYRPLPYLDVGGLTGGITLLVGIIAGIQQIRIVVGALSPNITSGDVVLEWLVNP